MKYPLVMVEWEDSFSAGDGWKELDEFEPPEPLVIRSVGWVLHKDRDLMVIVPHLGREHSRCGRQGCGVISIPRRAVRKVTKLRP